MRKRAEALTPLEKATKLLRQLAEHVAIRDANGEISPRMCRGCEKGQTRKNCPIPETLEFLNTMLD